MNPPYVLKADGLAAGKGVLIINELNEAKRELKNMLVDAKFDGESFVVLPEAKDYKRIGERDTGLNTGGMGAISPVPFVDDEIMVK
ncbi:unnamed protein product, partial [Cyprideis torosa]